MSAGSDSVAPTPTELARLLDAATPGPWRYVAGEVLGVGGPRRAKVADVSIAYKASAERDANAALIVAAVNALPTLLADLETMREVLEPLANLWVWKDDGDEDEVLCRSENGCLGLRVEHFRKAAAALQTRKAKP